MSRWVGFVGCGVVLAVASCGDDASSGAGGGGAGGSAQSSTTSAVVSVSSSSGGGEGGAGGEATPAPASVIHHRVVTTPTDELVVAGRVLEGVDYYGAVDTSDPINLVVAKLDTSLDRQWVSVFGVDQAAISTGPFIGFALQALDDGGVIYAATITGAVDVDTEVLPALGGEDVVVIRLDADGEVVWSRRVGGSEADALSSLIVVGDAVVATGWSSGSANFGGSDIAMGATYGSYFLASWSLADGAHRHSRRLAPGFSMPNTLIGPSLADVGGTTVAAIVPADSGAFTVDSVEIAATPGFKHAELQLDVATFLATSGAIASAGQAQPPLRRSFADAAGSIYYGGQFSGLVEIGGSAFDSDNSQLFVTAGSVGVAEWVHVPGGSAGAVRRGRAMCRSATGIVGYTGLLSGGTVQVGELELTAPIDPNLEGAKLWLAALDPLTGDVLAAADITALDSFNDCAFLSDERVVIYGSGGVAIQDLGL